MGTHFEGSQSLADRVVKTTNKYNLKLSRFSALKLTKVRKKISLHSIRNKKR